MQGAPLWSAACHGLGDDYAQHVDGCRFGTFTPSRLLALLGLNSRRVLEYEKGPVAGVFRFMMVGDEGFRGRLPFDHRSPALEEGFVAVTPEVSGILRAPNIHSDTVKCSTGEMLLISGKSGGL